ncbi:MAG: S1 family peptidase [Bifidobacteriaceae bacterium]|nr:S1 family peptidase [Bifidobacteriaceae bacterium]
MLFYAVLTPTPGAAALDPDQLSQAVSALDEEMVLGYAESAGVSADTARVRMAQEGMIVRALAASELEANDAKADVWIAEDGGELALHVRSVDPTSVTFLRDAARDAAMPLVTEAHTPVVAARTAVASKKAAELSAQIPGLNGFFIDVATGNLVLDVVGTAKITGSKTGGRAYDPAGLAEQITGLAAVANVVGPAGDTAAVNGGVALANCTVGFTATYKSGSTTYQGFLTAAHCQTGLTYFYNTAGTGSSKAAIYKTRRWDSGSDIAFHAVASGDTVTNKFFGASSTTTTTQSNIPSTALVGACVCKRGKASGYTCGSVQSIAYTPTWDNACNGQACSAVFTKNAQPRQGGDSGAPVWVSGTGNPVGIHKGGSSGVLGIGAYSVYSILGLRPSGTSLK